MTLVRPDTTTGALVERVTKAPAVVRGRVLRHVARREVQWAAAAEAEIARSTRVDLRYRWTEACRRIGLAQQIVTPLGGTTSGKVPHVVHVEAGPPAWLMVQMPPGIVMQDLDERAVDLAESVGAYRLRFTPRGGYHIRVDLIEEDPLRAPIPFLPPHPPGHVVFGVNEDGRVVSVPLDRLTHTIAQGATRTGKSAWCYAFLAQLAGRPDVRVAGIDPTALLLRPFGPDPWRAMGTDEPADRYAAAMAAVVVEMDRRIATMPARCDVVPTGPDCPLIVVVLEEWAGVGRLLSHSRAKPSTTHKHVARLLAEGAKAGVRVVLLVQRAEADVVGAFEREQLLTALTFGAATPDTLKMCHPWPIADALVEAQTIAPQGCALLNGPGLPVTRIRAPWIGGYGPYVDAVAG